MVKSPLANKCMGYKWTSVNMSGGVPQVNKFEKVGGVSHVNKFEQNNMWKSSIWTDWQTDMIEIIAFPQMMMATTSKNHGEPIRKRFSVIDRSVNAIFTAWLVSTKWW